MRSLIRARGALAAMVGLLLLLLPVMVLQQQARTERTLLDLSQARLASVDGLAASTIGNELAGVADAFTDSGRHDATVQAFDGARSDPSDTARLTATLAEMRSAFRSVEVTYALDAGGTLLVSEPPQPELYGEDFAYRDWFRGALSSQSAYVSDGFRSRAPGSPLGVGVAMAVRALDGPEEGEVVGVIGGLYLVDRLQDLVDEHGSTDGLRMTVLDRQGVVIARTGGLPTELEQSQDIRLLERLGTTGPDATATGRTRGADAVVWAATPIPETGGAVLSEVPVAISLAGLPQRHRELQVALLVLYLVIGLAVTAAVVLERRRARAQDVLRTRETQLAEAARLAGLGSFSVEPSTMAFTFDDALFRLWGVLPGDPLRQDPRVFADRILFPEDQPAVRATFEQGLVDGGRHEVGFRIRRVHDGAVRHIRSDVDVLLGPDGTPVRIVGTQLDVTELVTAHRELQEAGALHQALLRASPDVIVLTDADTGAPVYASPGLEQVLGRRPEDLIALGRRAVELVHPDDLARMRAADREVQDSGDGTVVRYRYRCLHADGTWRHLSRSTTPFERDASGRVTRALGVVRDVTDLVEAERLLEHAALHDALTGLPNRALLITRLAAALERSRRTGREPAVLYLDLDGFKHVNDTGGHAAGDAVLLTIAERLKQVLRPQDTVARLGGDEFVVLLEPWHRTEQVASPADDRLGVLAVAQRLIEAVSAPVRIDPHSHVVTASIGVAFADHGLRGTAGANALLQDADAAMYLAKEQGKNRYETFTSDLRSDLDERGRVEQLLRYVLLPTTDPSVLVPSPRQLARLSVAFQPVLTRSGGLVGFEALARLTDGTGRAVPPSHFIELAEQTGLIRAIGSRVLDQSLAQLARWRADGTDRDHLRIAVNLSAHELRDDGLVEAVLAAVQSHGLHPSQLVLELTETVLLDAGPTSLTALQRLREHGVGISIDDFGTGWASLRYLAELPVTSVKVDARFTAGLPHDVTSVKIVRAVSSLAADLGLSCVIEGVETLEQRDALPEGVLMQGYLLGRPVPAHELDLQGTGWRTALRLGGAELTARSGDLTTAGVPHGRVHAAGT